MKDCGNAIKILRKKNQMTQAMLAEKLNISGQAVSKWENNLAQPDFDTILKLTEVFHVTIDEFAKLCNLEGVVATPASEENEKQKQENPVPMFIGVCSACGISLYEEEQIAMRYPKLVCKQCQAEEEAKKVKEKKQKEEEKTALHRKNVSFFKKSLIAPAIIIGLLLITAIILSPSSTLVWIILFPLGYLAIVQIRWDNNFIADVFDFTFVRTFSMPGVIFTLDIDGILWAICVKIGLAILAVLLSVAVSILGFLFCMLLSPMFFPFSISKAIKEMKNNELL